MVYTKGFFTGFAKTKLFHQSWLPKKQKTIRAHVIFVHGVGEYSGRYAKLAHDLAQHHYAVHAFDLRCHGNSGTRAYAHVYRWREYREDLLAFIECIKKRYPNKEIHLIGQSMGSLIVLELLTFVPKGISSAITLSPPLVYMVRSPLLVFITRLISCLLPRFHVDNRYVDYKMLANNQAVVDDYHADKKNFNQVSMRWITEMKKAIDRVIDHASLISVPLLILQGADDKMAPKEGTQTVYQKVTSKKKIIVYPGERHDMLHDDNQERVLNDMLFWLDNKTS